MAMLTIVGIAFGAFSPVFFQGKILAPLDITTSLLAPWKGNTPGIKPHNHSPSDAVTQYLPYHIHAARSLHEDGYIGWNPYSMGGSSLAGNTMALPGSWTMQLHRFLDFKNAWNYGILAEFLIAGIGMLVFLRGRNLPWLACVLGAVAYMGNSQFVIWIYHRWALGAFCWMPWVLWASVNGLSWKSPNRRQLLLPFFLTLALLGGTLQHMVFVGLASGCLAAAVIFDSKATSRTRWTTFTAWSLAFSLAIGMAAFSLVPQVLGYLGNIEIGHTRGGIGYPEGFTQPFLNFIAIPAQIWPWLMGDPQTIDGWRLLKSDFMNLAYLGTIPMVLAFAGLFHRAMPAQAKWLILVGLVIPLTPLVGPLYHRVQLLFLLGGSWMAAEMLARFAVSDSRILVRGITVIVVALGVALLIGTAIPSKTRVAIENVVVEKSLNAAGSNFGNDPAWIESRARGWTDRFSLTNGKTAWVYALLAAGTAGLALARRPLPAWGNVVIIGATSLELFCVFQTWTTFSDIENLTPPHPAIERVRELAGPSRVMQGLGRVPLSGSFAAPNLLAAYSIPSVDAYESIQSPSISHTMRNGDPQSRLILAGVGISVQTGSMAAFEGTENWPIIGTVDDFNIRRNPQTLANVLAGTDPPPETADRLLPSLAAASSLQTDQNTMNHWTFNWPAGTRWVRISQNWHKGWQWKSGSSEWIPVAKGVDGACWIEPDRATAGKIEVRFFPRSPLLIPLSLVVGLVSIAYAIMILIRHAHRAESQNAELPLL